MATTKVLARNWQIEVEDDSDTDTFLEVGGITSIGFSQDTTNADATTYDSEGDEEHIPASKSREISLEGKYLEDKSTGDRDEGQERVENIAEKTGPEGQATFKLTSPGGTTKEFEATPTVETSGSQGETQNWTVTLNVSGSVSTTT